MIAAQTALEDKYDEAAELLETLKISTDSLVISLEEQRELVEVELREVRKVLGEMKEGERVREGWAKKVGEQVDDIVNGLPKVSFLLLSLPLSSLTGNNELNERWLDVGETSYFAISILARSFDRA